MTNPHRPDPDELDRLFTRASVKFAEADKLESIGDYDGADEAMASALRRQKNWQRAL